MDPIPRNLCSLALALGLISSTSAATLFSTVDQTPPSAGAPWFASNSLRWASDFRTGPIDVSVKALTTIVSYSGQSPVALAASLYADSGGLPGALVGTFATGGLVPGLASNVPVVLTDNGFTLNANTTYWLVTQMADSGSGVVIEGTSSDTTDPGGGGFTTVAGTGIAVSTNNGASWGGSFPGNLRFSLHDTAIPEPATTACVLFGLAGFASRRRRAANLSST